MHFGENEIRWTIGLCLDLLVAVLAYRSALFKRLPVFTAYLFVVALCDLTTTLLRGIPGVGLAAVFYEYWGGQALQIGLRGAAVAEVCYRILTPYKAVWRLWRIFLGSVAVVLLVSAALSAVGTQRSMTVFISTLQRGLELAIVGTLAFALLFAIYYQLHIQRFMVLIIAGLVFYSAVQIGNSQFLGALRGPYVGMYNTLALLAFDIATLTWLVAVWKPVPAVAMATPAAEAQALGISAPEMNARLRELNARLSEILR